MVTSIISFHQVLKNRSYPSPFHMMAPLTLSLYLKHFIGMFWEVKIHVSMSSPSDVCVRSLLYLFYNLIKLCHTKALSNQALSLALDCIPLLWRPRIPVSFTAQQQPSSGTGRQETVTQVSSSNNLGTPQGFPEVREPGWKGLSLLSCSSCTSSS